MRVFITFFVLLAAVHNAYSKLQFLHSWKYLDFEFPSDQTRQEMIANGSFIPGTALPLDIEAFEKDGKTKIFVSIPRLVPGVPVTLGTVEGSLIRPYPDWSWQSLNSCEGVTSVYRTWRDECDRLWAVDAGREVVQTFPMKNNFKCSPKIVAFDPNTDRVVHKYELPANVLRWDTRLVGLVVDVRDPQNECTDTHVYLADAEGNAIIVVDVKRKKSWRVVANSLYPHPTYGHFDTNNVEFDFMDGNVGLALGPIKDGDRKLYYHALATFMESWVPASILQNDSFFPDGRNLASKEFHTSEYIRSSQVDFEAVDKNGVLYYSPLADNSILCWNTENPDTPENNHELIKDDVRLQFVMSFKIRENEKGEEILYGLSNRFHLFWNGQTSMDEINYRVFKVRISDLTKGTPCEKKSNAKCPHSHNVDEL